MRDYPILPTITCLISALLLFCCSQEATAQNAEGVNCSFSRTDTTYLFKGSFDIVGDIIGDIDSVMPIFFEYDHVKALSPDAKNVELIEQGESWNTISFVYGIFPNYENESIWYRVVDPERNRVDFNLVSSKNSHAIMPQMVSSSGFYHIYRSNDTITIEYCQQCLLTKSLITDLYLQAVKKRAIEFIYLFKEYAINYCDSLH
jgi:hypothetical protein